VEYKDKFATLVQSYLAQEKKDRLIIMIDDLDRVAPEKALDLLSSVKVFLDVEQCVFVLAVDYDVIQRGVAQKMGTSTQKVHGKSFFDKIIQVPFNMPVSAYKLDEYLLSLLNKKFLTNMRGKTTPENIAFLTSVTRLTVGANPRSIKRVVNYATLLQEIVREKRRRTESGKHWKVNDALTLYPLACLQLAWPEIFNYFVRQPSPLVLMRLQNWEFIESLPEARGLFERSSDKELTITNIQGFFDEYIDLVDKAQDGKVHVNEFRAVWDMLQEANLTSVKLENNNELWSEFMERVAENAGNSPGFLPEQLKIIHSLFSTSQWNNELRFRMVPAGKRFINLLWDGNQIGSLASHKTRPFTFLLTTDHSELSNLAPSCRPFLVDATTEGQHAGVGDTRVVIEKIASVNRANSRRDLMDALLIGLLDARARGFTEKVPCTKEAVTPVENGSSINPM
jgi:hypothetical protein